MILITGATGTNGSEIVKQLVAKGNQVKALVRNPAKANWLQQLGVEVVEGDFTRPETLMTALEGVEKALMLPPLESQIVEWQKNFIKAAKRANTKHIVKFSGMGASLNSPFTIGRLHGEAEKLLEDSGIPFTHLRPNSFMQNTLSLAATIKSEGVFYQPAAQGKIAHVDVRDIAAVAVAVLTEENHTGKAYEITGPVALSFDEVAEKISVAIGKPVKYIDVSGEDFKQSLIGWGQSEWLANVVTELYEEVYKQGLAATITDTVRKIAKKEPITFEQFLQDHLQVFTTS